MVLHFLIQGRVQGVGFRWFVQREASELDLRGWVRNTEEGEVEVVASGSQNDLAELRASLRRGPPRQPRRPPHRALPGRHRSRGPQLLPHRRCMVTAEIRDQRSRVRDQMKARR